MALFPLHTLTSTKACTVCRASAYPYKRLSSTCVELDGAASSCANSCTAAVMATLRRNLGCPGTTP